MNISNLHKTWNQRLKERMTELGMTQQDLANILGIQRSGISHYLNGQRTQITVPKLTSLEKAIQVVPGWLMYGEEALKGRKNEKIPDFSEILVPVLEFCDVYEYVKYGKLPENCEHKLTLKGSDMEKGNFKKFYIRVIGDSMVSESKPQLSMFESELVLVDANKSWGHGSFVVAKIGKNTKIRQLQIEGSESYLQALNPKVPNLPIDEEVKILGTVTGKLTEYV